MVQFEIHAALSPWPLKGREGAAKCWVNSPPVEPDDLTSAGSRKSSSELRRSVDSQGRPVSTCR